LAVLVLFMATAITRPSPTCPCTLSHHEWVGGWGGGWVSFMCDRH
jgi:hypothetical protein